MLFRGFIHGDGRREIYRDTDLLEDVGIDMGIRIPLGDFDWPGPSEGSAGLALALLAESVPPMVAFAYYRLFDETIVRGWTGDRWACTSEGIQEWVDKVASLAIEEGLRFLSDAQNKLWEPTQPALPEKGSIGHE